MTGSIIHHSLLLNRIRYFCFKCRFFMKIGIIYIGYPSKGGNEMKKFSIADDTPAEAKPAAGFKLLPPRVAISADGATVVAGDTAGRIHAWATK